MEGSQNLKSRSRDPFPTPFDLILHFFVSAPVINLLVKFEVSSSNRSRDKERVPKFQKYFTWPLYDESVGVGCDPIFDGATMTIKGSLQASIAIVMTVLKPIFPQFGWATWHNVCDILKVVPVFLFHADMVIVCEQHITIWRDQLQGVTFHLFVVRELHAVGRNRTRSIIFSSLASSKMDIKRGVINVGRGECLTFTTEAVIKSSLGKINASTHATPVDCRKFLYSCTAPLFVFCFFSLFPLFNLCCVFCVFLCTSGSISGSRVLLSLILNK